MTFSYVKNKLKSEIFNDKNVHKQKFFSVYLSLKLGNFNKGFSYFLKDGTGLRMKNFNIMGFTEKFSF